MALYHRDKGSVNYTVVGTPTIVDGVVSGCSSSDYVQVQAHDLIDNTSFEYITNVDFSNNSSIPANGTMLRFPVKCKADSSKSMWGGIYAESRGVLDFNLGYDASNNVIASYLSFDNFKNKNVFIRYRKEAGVLYVDYSVDNKQTWVAVANDGGADNTIQLSNIAFAFGAINWSTISFNFNETYIKINGQAWFGNCPIEVKHINYGTSVGYTKVGSPTISNGVVSNCSSSSYLTIPAFGTTVNSLSIQLTITMDSTLSTFRTLAYIGNMIFEFYGNNSHAFRFAYTDDNGTRQYKVVGSSRAELGVPQIISVDYSNGEGTIVVTQNGNTLSSNTYSMTAPRADLVNQLGYYWQPLTDGSINLNETYIKVNGNLWFYRPATNYLIKDGKLIWADGNVFIDDNGTKTYASANIAPVPSGFTYGTTTTSDVGWVDMRTQAFTAVPGATWGKD